MDITCRRCHETLREEDRYCPSCGLPHLVYVASDASVISVVSASGSLSDSVSPETGANFGYNSGIAWRPALRVALLLSLPASVLCSSLSPLGLLCIAAAAAWAVSLYTKRTRNQWLSTGNGARIGLALGAIASWLSLAFDGGSLWVARFVLHQGAEFDALVTSTVAKSYEQNQQMIAQMGMATAESAQMGQYWRDLMLSANGRAGMALAGFLLVAVFSMLFATVGGAVGARLLAQPRRPGA